MLITATDLISPKGEIEPSLFPTEDAAALEARLTAYLAQAYARDAVTNATDPDAAAEAWAYHRAYTAVYLRIAAAPASLSQSGEVQRTFGAAQADRFLRLASAALEKYEAAVKTTQSATRKSTSARPSTSIATGFVF